MSEPVIESGGDALLVLTIDKAAAGGRMLARHDGQVVLVSAAIPGERVEARVERARKGVVYAETQRVLQPSPDRRAAGAGDWRCGGNVFAHIAYDRQLQLKAEIVQDAFRRLARVPLASAPDVIGSPERGYRMRARLHARGARLGFYREGTHELCDVETTGQLLPATVAWIRDAEARIRGGGVHGLAAVELAENIAGDERACHLELTAGAEVNRFAALGEGLRGLSAQRADRPDAVTLKGRTAVADRVRLRAGTELPVLPLARDVRAFFQGNRFLLEPLGQHVTALVDRLPLVDLYAGVGLFGLSAAALGLGPVWLVEGDPVSGADLQRNAVPFGARVRVERRSVESFLEDASVPAGGTFVIDPPRTGLSRAALAGVIHAAPGCIVYVSCDVATLARDAGALIAAGFELQELKAFDLFPNTAHIETVAVFRR
jgi:tRNA/tmRNA/rRNA uracil-C5-methylase (TrmA/RlmC/RlmD family)